MPRFRGLCDYDYGDLAAIVAVESYKEGAIIYRTGDKCDKVYSLTSGLIAESEFFDEDLTVQRSR